MQESANMPYFGSKEDEQTMDAIERWKLTAATEVDDIAVWRDVDPDQIECGYWSERPLGSGGIHNSTASASFFSDTTHIVRRIVNDYQRLDPAPIQEIHAAVAAWHDDHTAARIPPQPKLLALLERAMMNVLVVEGDIRSRFQATPPKASSATDGEWSLPMSKNEMASRLRLGLRAFDTFANQHGLKRVSRQQFQIRLDGMDERTRERLGQRE